MARAERPVRQGRGGARSGLARRGRVWFCMARYGMALSKRPRPSIPASVKVAVAIRQLNALSNGKVPERNDEPFPQYLSRLLHSLSQYFSCDPSSLELHHRPALINRPFNPRTNRYKPEANDPDHLIYLEENTHRIETLVRGVGAMRSDISERQHQRRMDENRGKRKRKPKAKIASRPFQNGRKFR